MQILTAINTMLTAAGEATVLAIDTGHPLERSLLAVLDEVSAMEQSKGWWFNEYRNLLQPDADGAIILPSTEVARIRPTHGQAKFVKKGDRLLDYRTRSDVFDRPVDAIITEQWEFEDLPDTFARYVTALAALQAATSYDADAGRIQALGTAVDLARSPMMKEHVDNVQVNMFETPSMHGRMNGVRHNRYGVGTR